MDQTTATTLIGQLVIPAGTHAATIPIRDPDAPTYAVHIQAPDGFFVELATPDALAWAQDQITQATHQP